MSTAPFRSTDAVVAIVEDDADLRDALAGLLAASGYRPRPFATAEAMLADGVPDAACLVTDVRLGPGLDGVGLLAALRGRGSTMPVVVVTGHADVELAVRAMRQGALDFIEKPFDPERLLAAVEEAVQLSARLQPMQGLPMARARIACLTPREKEVLASLVDGNANKGVAHALGISARTVAAYRASIMEKLAVRSFAEAVRVAVAAGLSGEAV